MSSQFRQNINTLSLALFDCFIYKIQDSRLFPDCRSQNGAALMVWSNSLIDSLINARAHAYGTLFQQHTLGSRGSAQLKTGFEPQDMTNSTYIPMLGSMYQLTPYADGGVCHVFEARAIHEEKPVTMLKMIRSEWLSHKALEQQFALEAEILQTLKHPALPRFIAKGFHNGHAFLAYEKRHGEPLMAYAKRRELYGDQGALTQIVSLMDDLLEQLAHLHTKKKPVAHGDIGAENIIYATQAGPQLLDFGCAHFSDSPTMNSHRWIAKPSYLSPEQAQGVNWSWMSDIYQMGILSYELLTGKRWITGNTPEEKMLNAARKTQPNLNFLGPDVPREVSDCVRDMLHPDPEIRAQYTAHALVKRLKSVSV